MPRSLTLNKRYPEETDRIGPVSTDVPVNHNEEKPIDSTMVAAVWKAFDGPDDWRSAWGIANEIDLPQDTVQDILDKHSDCFARISLAPSGIQIYRRADR